MVTRRDVYNLKRGTGVVGRTITKDAREHKLIIYGMQSVSKQVPTLLFGRQTDDYDVYSRTPQKAARRVERKLDNRFGGDYFYVKKAVYGGTYRIMSRVSERNVADYTKPKRKVPVRVIQGVRYASVNSSMKDKRASLRDPAFSFRHEKDREDLKIMTTWKKLRRF